MSRHLRISKREWYARGGFANPALWRRQRKDGAWQYFVDLSREAWT